MVAEASGTPPAWIRDTPGTEAWALVQAASQVEHSCTYKTDCQGCVKVLHGTPSKAKAAKNPLARVYNLLLPLLDDTPREAVCGCQLTVLGIRWVAPA